MIVEKEREVGKREGDSGEREREREKKMENRRVV